jgi:hypothetical protein
MVVYVEQYYKYWNSNQQYNTCIVTNLRKITVFGVSVFIYYCRDTKESFLHETYTEETNTDSKDFSDSWRLNWFAAKIYAVAYD